MKRLFVFAPAILLVLFLLNSFVLNEKIAGKKTTKGTKSLTSLPENNPAAKAKNKPVLANILYKSIDGGQTWQDISEGLPEIEQPLNLFAGSSGLYLHVKNVMYRSKRNLKTPVWEKDNVPDLQNASSSPSTSIAFNHSGVMAFNYKGQVYQKMTAAENWLPIQSNLNKYAMRTIFETSAGTVFRGYDDGLYKSTDKGKDWKKVQNEGWVMGMVESEGVLVATGTKGIMRSTDNGEHWKWVINEGGVGIAIERIEGGFAAIAYNTETKSRRIHISLNSGKTWKAISDGLPPSMSISSIKQIGKYLICGHPDGIFRSSDMGKTWNSVHPSVDKVDKNRFTYGTSLNSEPQNIFKIYVSGNVVYALAGNAGC